MSVLPSPVDPAALPAAIRAAHGRLRAHIRETPCDESLALGQRLLGRVWLKGEHLQHTGSFKARGALHKLCCLTAAERSRGVVAASSGNHGAGVAWAARLLGIRARIYVPEQASATKVAMIRRYGAEVQHAGTDGVDTEMHARDVAEREGQCYVSPYNDVEVVCGQGTVGVEMAAQAGALDAVIVAVGGGGLIAGVAAALKASMPAVRVIGALPANSPVMAESVAAGHIVERESFPTLSDGTAGGIEAGAITFPLCQQLVDEWVLVDEAAIASAMVRFIDEHHQLIEGSAGVALAALEARAHRGGSQGLAGERLGVVLCGANIALGTLRGVLQRAG
jgi:threonine dehydratase